MKQKLRFVYSKVLHTTNSNEFPFIWIRVSRARMSLGRITCFTSVLARVCNSTCSWRSCLPRTGFSRSFQWMSDLKTHRMQARFLEWMGKFSQNSWAKSTPTFRKSSKTFSSTTDHLIFCFNFGSIWHRVLFFAFLWRRSQEVNYVLSG